MKIIGEIIKHIYSEEGVLLTQSDEVVPEERIFSSKIYDENINNWTEWTLEAVSEFRSKILNTEH